MTMHDVAVLSTVLFVLDVVFILILRNTRLRHYDRYSRRYGTAWEQFMGKRPAAGSTRTTRCSFRAWRNAPILNFTMHIL